jgi:HD-GYP domain-containing protein (c-di-GMP phosphodiesterase class II)
MTIDKDREVSRAEIRRVHNVGKRFTYRIATLIRTAQIHKMSNRALDNPLTVTAGSATSLFQDQGFATLQGEGDVIHINQTRVRVERAQVKQVRFLNEFLRERGVGGFEILGPSLAEDWRTVLAAILEAPTVEEEDSEAWQRLNERLSRNSVESVRFSQPMRLTSGSVGGDGGGEGGSIAMAGSRSLQLYLRALRVVAAFYQRESSQGLQSSLRRIMQFLVEQAMEEPRQHLALVQLKGGHAYELRHPVNTAILSIALGHAIGLPRVALLDLGMGAVLCDLGMRELPESVRFKTSPLDSGEQKVLEQHPLASVRATVRMGRMDLATRRWMVTAFEHHMSHDQGGYPQVQDWPALHLFSRIIAIAETYDALTTQRPGQEGLLPDEALAKMLEAAGESLDPVLVALFVNLTGCYPLGSLLLLSTGEVGVVYMTPSDAEDLRRPVVRLLLDRFGTQVRGSKLVDLRDKDAEGAWVRSAARVVRPEDLGVDLNRAIFT